ncbi:transducin family protein / WD-40 repeat family protein [Wolffia australiana]
MAELAESRFFAAEAAAAPPPPSRRPRHGTCSQTSPESKFWRSFRNSQLSSGLIHAVTDLEFSPTSPHDLAAAVSANINLYGGADLAPKPFSPIHHFDDVAFSPSFRCDGALLAVGGQSGLVQIFDPSKGRLPLRRLRGHSRPVRLVRYPQIADKTHLFSGGDDAVLNYWDAAAESKVSAFPAAHKDYIRAGAASPTSPELIATGSYDHTVQFWDVRAGESPVLSINHGEPVESVLFLPSGGLVATAGGDVVKLWDVIGGGRAVHRLDCHTKTVTSLCLARLGQGEPRLVTAALDGFVKVFDFAAFRITHSTRYPAMLLSVAVSPAADAVVAGTSNGVIYIGRRKKERTPEGGGEAKTKTRPPLRPSSFRYFRRGQSEKPAASDVVVRQPRPARLAEHDKLLKRFEHGRALAAALGRRHAGAAVAVMQELVARKKLVSCVRTMDVDGLGLLLGFLHRNATMPRYARFLMNLAARVVRMRAEDIQASAALRGLARNIKRMVSEEMKVQQALQEIQGIVSPLIRIVAR